MRDRAPTLLRATALAWALLAALATGAHAGPLGVRADDASQCAAPTFRQLQADPASPIAPPVPPQRPAGRTEVVLLPAPVAPRPADVAAPRAREARAPPALVPPR